MSTSVSPGDDGTHRIVVGVDGSPGSHAALRWAAQEATRLGADVVAVHAWDFPIALGGLPTTLPPAELQQAAEQLVARTVTEALGTDPGVRVEPVAIAGSPAAVLLDQAKDADLLVVGARGRGGFVGLLLGSVSNQVVAHAVVPTVVVPTARDAPDSPHGESRRAADRSPEVSPP